MTAITGVRGLEGPPYLGGVFRKDRHTWGAWSGRTPIPGVRGLEGPPYLGCVVRKNSHTWGVGSERPAIPGKRGLEGPPYLGGVVRKELPEVARLDVGEDPPVPDVLQVVRYVVHHLLPYT